MANDDTGLTVVASVNEIDEFIDFKNWLRTGAKRFKFIGIAGIVVPAAAVTYYTTGILHNTLSVSIRLPTARFPPETVSYAAQIAVVFAILVLNVAFVTPSKDDRFERGNRGQASLRKWWGVALVSFLLLYIMLWWRASLSFDPTVATANSPGSLAYATVTILANLCNNLSTLAFLMCFSTMESSAKRASDDDHRWVLLWIGCLVMLTFFEAAITIKNPATVQQWKIHWFDLLTGANAGIALAMFVARLSSPLINLPTSVTALLYLYAIVQITFGFWQDKDVATIMANVCLVLKCLLSLVVAWLLTTKHLIFFIERLHDIRREMAISRNKFRKKPLRNVKSA